MQDVAQETFQVFFAKWQADGMPSEPALLMKIAHDRMCNWWRHHSRTPEDVTDYAAPGRETAKALMEASTEFTAGVVSQLDLANALQRIPARQREALALRFQDGLTLQESATLMGVSVSAVKKLVGAGLAKLHESPLLREYIPTEVRE